MSIVKRFWMAYSLTCAVWLLAGVSVAALHFTKRAMPRDAQLTLRGGQCPPTGSTCSSTCNAPDGDCSKSGITMCKDGKPCDTASVPKDSTGLPNDCGGAAGETACALTAPTDKCNTVQPCVCEDNGNGGFNCGDGTQFDNDVPVCIQGAEGQPT